MIIDFCRIGTVVERHHAVFEFQHFLFCVLLIEEIDRLIRHFQVICANRGSICIALCLFDCFLRDFYILQCPFCFVDKFTHLSCAFTEPTPQKVSFFHFRLQDLFTHIRFSDITLNSWLFRGIVSDLARIGVAFCKLNILHTFHNTGAVKQLLACFIAARVAVEHIREQCFGLIRSESKLELGLIVRLYRVGAGGNNIDVSQEEIDLIGGARVGFVTGMQSVRAAPSAESFVFSSEIREAIEYDLSQCSVTVDIRALQCAFNRSEKIILVDLIHVLRVESIDFLIKRFHLFLLK